MGNARPAQHLSHATRTGLRDLPAMLPGCCRKLWRPAVSAGSASSRVLSRREHVRNCLLGGGARPEPLRRACDGTKAARQSVVEVVPGLGHDPVASLMQQADAAAEQRGRKRHCAGGTGQQQRGGPASGTASRRTSCRRPPRSRGEEAADRVEEAQERFDRAAWRQRPTDTVEEAERRPRPRSRPRNADSPAPGARGGPGAASALARARNVAARRQRQQEDVAAQPFMRPITWPRPRRRTMTTDERQGSGREAKQRRER